MDQLLGTIFGAALGFVGTAAIDATAHERKKKKRSSTVTSNIGDQQNTVESFNHPLAASSLNENSTQQFSRAFLVTTNSEEFGKICERLVNIAFQTSQSCPSMMSTCADISNYLRKELAKTYPTQHFHIIVAQNHAFGFAVHDASHIAEIEQDHYRVLIYTTKRNIRSNYDTHDANSLMSINWNLSNTNKKK